MSELKIVSLRLESDSLQWADKMASDLHYYSRSDIIRLAIWVGTKVIISSKVSELNVLRWVEEFKGINVSLENVLHTAGVELEDLKRLE